MRTLWPLALLCPLVACATPPDVPWRLAVGDNDVLIDDDDTVGDDDDSSGDDDDDSEPVTCELVEGRNTGFLSGGQERTFDLLLPANPDGAAVLFGWHWLGGSATELALGFDLLGLVQREDVIAVVPESCCSDFEWQFDQPPAGNADLELFDDVLGCLVEQYGIDEDRVYSSGFSAGGLWTSYLAMHRGDVLAAAAPVSGGTDAASYRSPDSDLPVLLTWGGPSDLSNGFDFHTGSQLLSSNLRADGSFIIECEHTGGHTAPAELSTYLWPFLSAHPRGGTPPWTAGLPAFFPDYCRVP